MVYTKEMENPEYVKNNPDRCFHSKTALADKVDEVIHHYAGKYDYLLYGAQQILRKSSRETLCRLYDHAAGPPDLFCIGNTGNQQKNHPLSNY
jgi:hypothetical protein